MISAKRIFLVVLDSVGAGEAPDAKAFGDIGAHTLRSVFETGALKVPTLIKMGIGNIDGLDFLGQVESPSALVARMCERSAGKDTTIGHWEIAGSISSSPMPTFPEGFPGEVIERLERAFGREIICNAPYSGTKVIADFGEEHLRSGKLIVYTSADSVLQIAAHTDIVPLEELYGYCRMAREIMTGDGLCVGRVIARPFKGEVGAFVRTADRRDFSAEPPKGLMPEAIASAGLDSIAVGKISDIFAGRGFTESYPTHSNREGMETLERLARRDFNGLCFANLVDFDMLWGHRRDADAYANGLCEFDRWLGGFIPEMKADDVLIITADHGCDPAFTATTDHTREYTPCLIYSELISGGSIGTRSTFADIGATVTALLGVPFDKDGERMINL